MCRCGQLLLRSVWATDGIGDRGGGSCTEWRGIRQGVLENENREIQRSGSGIGGGQRGSVLLKRCEISDRQGLGKVGGYKRRDKTGSAERVISDSGAVEKKAAAGQSMADAKGGK